ncbi:MAG: ribokinase [Clostridiaceae bacterium]|nr:ribokinase [Clostridiaceae bacterium]
MVINFGSLNIDYVYTMDHFIRPGETYTADRLDIFPGGKGLNQSIAVARAGGHIGHVGCIGREGGFLLDFLAADQVDVSGVSTLACSNGHAIIQVDKHGENCIILYSGANRNQPDDFVPAAAARLNGSEIVLFQNETDGIAEMMCLAKDKGCRIALNPAPMDERALALPLNLVDYLIVNEGEGAALLGYDAASGCDQPDRILEQLAQRYPQARIILTLGGRGMLFAWRTTRLDLPAWHAGPVVDTTAAGDTFIGTYLALIDNNQDDPAALSMAVKAAGLTVTRAGAASSIPHLREYMNL